MKAEEIKETITMSEVLSRYGVAVNRSGMCSCPFHKDRKPSMKVYKDGFKCFSCNRGGDIFKFVQEYENCSFKDAFISLGGTYEQHENNAHKRLIKAKFDRQKAEREKASLKEKEFRTKLENAIFKCIDFIKWSPVFCDEWCICQNALPWLEEVWDTKYLQGKEVNEIDVIRLCGRIEKI